MAKFRYFKGETELTNVRHDGSIYTTAKHFSGVTPEGDRVQVTRAIEIKSNPSRHKCDARCLNAKGFKCECECNGRNHGRGFECEAA